VVGVHRRLFMLLVAVALACIDLAEKAEKATEYHHARSSFAVLATTCVVIGLVVLVPLLPSRAALLGAALATGGALGNLVSVIVWAQGVPDPLVVGGPAHGIAFNLADVFVFIGDAVMLSSVVIYAVRHRAELRVTV
jgi:lipoprotein signal peptidase